MDCAGVLEFICTEVGYDAVDFRGYRPVPQRDLLAYMLQLNFDEVDAPEPADLIVFSTRREPPYDPTHVAVYVGPDENGIMQIVHVCADAGEVLIEPLAAWSDKIHSYWRFRGL